MPTLKILTEIQAPPKRVFDLARSIDLHTDSMKRSREHAVAGVTSGLIGLGESVTWKARHFGIWFSLESRIVGWDPPVHFCDSMVSGPFTRFDHDHYFEESGAGTTMRDVFDYTSPFGPMGLLADRIVLARYMRKLLADRAVIIKSVAESDSWRSYL